ncbi:Nucleosomal histone H3-Lys79 methylase [Coemansia sp. RSA 2598]|nr:Nucleosomal histone H3-Lys79 methylase [Coemansia sp. RSA 2598]
MDLFFGAAKAKAKGQPQTVSIRVEERVVGRKHSAAASASAAASKTNAQQQQQQLQPACQRTSPAKRHMDSVHEGAHGQRHKRQRARERARERDRDGEGRLGNASDGEDDRMARPAARRLAKSSAMSARDAHIVNSNRERVGSLPGTPRPRKEEPMAKRRSPQAQRPKRERASPRVAEEQVEIGRCLSVPAHMSAAAADNDNDNDSVKDNDNNADSDEGKDRSGRRASIISSVDAVRQSETPYEAYFLWAADEREPPSEIELHLPAGGRSGRERYSLMMPRGYDRESERRDDYLPIDDLLATVRAIGMYLVGSERFRQAVVDDQEGGIVRRLERARNRRNGADFVAAVRDFNALLDKQREATDGSSAAEPVPAEVAVFVVEQVYSRVVAPTVGLLRQYKAFSNNVYGEILPTLVSEFISRTGISAASTFVDLGCGIGNVVLQVAAQTGCRASGIEIMKVPARFAQRQAREFEHRMRLYGLRHGAVSIWRGDFCESGDVQRVLPTADVLLVNNYAFDSALNQNLLQMFLDLKEGTRVISLRPFVTPDHKISARNVYAPESILAVKRYPYWSNCVSWTDSGGEYFVQTVDRSRVKQFLARREAFV